MSYLDDEGPHSLLEPATPAYSNATVRRAFIVWMQCGQKNTFKDVCNFYHHLECLEDKLPADDRASSRHHEFNMFNNPPPTSQYLNTHFPKLYTQSHTIQNYMKKADTMHKNRSFTDERQHNTTHILRQENLKTPKTLQYIKLKHYTLYINLAAVKGKVPNDVYETSVMIQTYCLKYVKPMWEFLMEFYDYAQKCNLSDTVENLAFYVKRKMVEKGLHKNEKFKKSLEDSNLNEKKSITKKTYKKTNDFFKYYLKNLTKAHHEVYMRSIVTRT